MVYGDCKTYGFNFIGWLKGHLIRLNPFKSGWLKINKAVDLKNLDTSEEEA